MRNANFTNFRSVGDALRFYFRASEILATTENRDGHDRSHWTIDATTDDYLAVRSLVSALHPLKLLILREVYGPDCFGKPFCTLGRARVVANQRYPELRLTREHVSRILSETMVELKGALGMRDIVPVVSSLPGSPSTRPNSSRTNRQQVQGDHAHRAERFIQRAEGR